MTERTGKRKTRGQLSKSRIPELGYYPTDTEKTEHNYLVGLRDSMPKELQRKLLIKVCKAKTTKLVNEAKRMRLNSHNLAKSGSFSTEIKLRILTKLLPQQKKKILILVGQIHASKYGLVSILAQCRHIQIQFLAVRALRSNMCRRRSKNMKKPIPIYTRNCVIMATKRKQLKLRKENMRSMKRTAPKSPRICVLVPQYIG